MYQQPNHSYASAESLRRLSSNNPFRSQAESTRVTSTSSSNSNNSTHLVKSPPSRNFDTWVEKNKKLIEEDDSFDDESFGNYLLSANFTNSDSPNDFAPPSRPSPVRTSSDSGVKLSSNNPFSGSLGSNNSYVHHRDAPPVPKSSTPPSRPPKQAPPPPSYEEAAGREAARREYAREKHSNGSSSSSSRPRRSHSDGTRPHRSHRSERERTERERDGRHGSHHHSKSRRSPTKKQVEPVKSKNLDTIDKLDVTGFFGGGFHHDGPFDACTPHRNKDGKLAPVMAFPVDGPNSSIKGGAKIDPDQQIKLAFGNYSDHNEIGGASYSTKLVSKSSEELPLPKTNKTTGQSLYTPKENPSIINFDSNMKSEPVHGYPTAGLGSTTFLDGAPAPRNDDSLNMNNGGLGRKKSLVQRLRKTSAGSDYSVKNRSNEELNISHSYDSNEGGSSLIRRVKSLKVGRRER